MLVVNTKEIFLLNLHQNRVHFPAERNAFVLDHQHGRRDVTCKPAINRGLAKIYRFRVKNTENQAIFVQFLHFSRVSKSLLRVNFCQKMRT